MIKDKYNKRAEKINSLLCVGLDSDFAKLSGRFKELQFPQFEFNQWIIDETVEFASAFKPNMAFYEARGEQGLKELKLTMDYLRAEHPDVFTICDAKRADIGNANNGYVEAIFDYFGFDAITLHPYLGKEALKPFLDRADKISIILCRTSNPGAAELQDLEFIPSPALPTRGREIQDSSSPQGGGGKVGGKALWQIVAEKVSSGWNYNHNCMLVVGATYPKELKVVRSIAGEMTLLVPGIGAQGGDVESVVKAGLNSSKMGMIINSSRGIIFAESPKEEAGKLRDEINKYR